MCVFYFGVCSENLSNYKKKGNVGIGVHINPTWNGIQCEEATSKKKQPINNTNNHIYNATKQTWTHNYKLWTYSISLSVGKMAFYEKTCWGKWIAKYFKNMPETTYCTIQEPGTWYPCNSSVMQLLERFLGHIDTAKEKRRWGPLRHLDQEV